MNAKYFNELTLTQQRELANRVSQGLTLPSVIWLRAMQETNPLFLNIRVKGSGWDYIEHKSFLYLIDNLKKTGHL